jgi:hypothetical protein
MGEIADEHLDRMLFGHDRWRDDGSLDDEHHPAVRCNRCGSTDVRWRQQTGKWVLFSLTPGVEHVCTIADPFTVVQD